VTFEPFLFWVAHYIFLTGVGILSYGIGRKLTQRIRFNCAAEQFSFCTTLGLGILSYLVLLIGTFGFLYRWLVITVMGLILLLCSSAWVELFNGASSVYGERGGVRWRPMISVLLTLLVISPVFLLPLYPPTAFDSTMYHLAYSKLYVQSGRIVFTPYLRCPVSPQTNEMLFTLAMLLYDGVAAQLIQFLMMGVLTVGLIAFGRRHFSQKTGIWAGAIFLSNPMVLWLGASAYIDIGLALFVTIAIYSIFNWIQLKEERWLILGALFFGFSTGSKYSALFFLVLFSLVIVTIGIKNRKYRPIFLFVIIAVGVALPWYFRNWYYTGNPVFPFFGQIFGYGLWSPQDLQGQLQDLMQAHGMGRSLQSFLFLPWNLAFHQPKFQMEAPYSQIYLFALPFLFLSLRRSKIRQSFIIIFLYTLFWFSSAQILRYLIPIIPLLSLTTAASIESCLEWLLVGKVKWIKKGVVTFAIVILFFAPGWLYAVYKVNKEGYPPYTNRKQEIYLTRKLPTFPAYQYLNQTRGRDYSLYALFDENMAYFADGIFMGDWFGPGRFEKIYGKFSNLEALHRELQLLGANYFLIRRDRVKVDMPREDDFLQSHFKQVYENAHVLLFEVL